MRAGTVLLCALVSAAYACARPEPDARQGDEPPPPAGGTVHEYAHLEDEVQHLLAFLRGDAPLRESALADTVTLHVAPEGGGDVRKVARHELTRLAGWRVGSRSLVPPSGLGEIRLTPGLHSHCEAVGLETRYPELARQPHVGVRLAPDAVASCLQTWNATFVFTADATNPRLSAVVYDQWEW